MNESLTLYKLIILYLMKECSAPLTNGQISEFILEKEYTDYITLQQAIAELIESEFIRLEEVKNATFYHITDQGVETARLFKEKISDAIIEDILEYTKANKLEIINKASVLTEYYKTTSAGYDVNLKIREKSQVLMDLTLNVDTKAEAETICRNFKEKNQDVYEYIIKKLML